MNARFLNRTDVPPLREDVPIDAIARWLAREIQETGHVTHEEAHIGVMINFRGIMCFYSEPECNKRGKVTRNRILIHPEILRALKKFTGKNIIWGKECREWWAKGVGEAARRAIILQKFMPR
jgi:hypothetical protein